MQVHEETIDEVVMGDDPDVPHAYADYSFPSKYSASSYPRIFQSSLSEWASQHETQPFTLLGAVGLASASQNGGIDISFYNDGPNRAGLVLEMIANTDNFQSLTTAIKSIISKYILKDASVESAKKVQNRYAITRNVDRLEREMELPDNSLAGVAEAQGVPSKQYNLIRKTIGRGRRRKSKKSNRSVRVKRRK